jgi:hypothetical protein
MACGPITQTISQPPENRCISLNMAETESSQSRHDVPPEFQPGRSIMTSLVITALALMAIRLLHHIPIADTADVLGRDGFVPASAHSIAAVALKSWLMAAVWTQLIVMIVPKQWTLRLIRNGYVNPFGAFALLATAGLAFMHAAGIGVALYEIVRPTLYERFQLLAVGSLMAGTALFIFNAWLIERFGIGYGFWIAIAMQTILDISTTMSQWFAMFGAGAYSPATIITGCAILVAMAALIVLITLHAQRHGGNLGLVTWPPLVMIVVSYPATNLVLESLDLSDRIGEFPGVLAVIVPVTLLVLAAITFVLTRRSALPQLFIPVLGGLALVEITAFIMPLLLGGLPLPLPTGAFVATVALLTMLMQQLWQAQTMPKAPATT